MMQNDVCKYMYRKWSSHVKTRADLINLSTLTISANTKKSKEKWNCNGIEFFFLVLDLFVYVNGKISFLPKLDYIFFMRLEMLKPNSNKTSTFKKYLNCSSFNQSQDKTRAIFGQILFEFGFLYLKFALPIALPILYMVLIVFSSIILSLSHIIKSYINVIVSTKV